MQPNLNRRAFLVSGAAALSALRAMPSTPACVLTTEQEEGPYYVDDEKMRADITEGKPGVPLRLRVALLNAKTCSPLPAAALDIWHCDASGVYSGFVANGSRLGGPGGPGRFPGGPPPDGPGPDGPPPDGPPPTGFFPRGRGPRKIDATRFLRGVQLTNNAGLAEFTTIYPGWYQGRAIHIHLKVHSGGHVAHTGQLFFPEEITARIARLEPYKNHKDVHLTTLAEDMVFEPQHGAAGMMTLNRIETKSDAAGFLATVTLAVDPEATPRPTGIRGPAFPRG